jgi:DNA-directed RNA polymerase specialized sigma24 family protein
MVLNKQSAVSRLALAELVRECDHELSGFRAGQSPGAAHCFELLRRAFADESQDAFACVFGLYAAQVARWVSGHRMFRASGEDTPDVFVNEAFVRLFRNLRGVRFDDFASAEAVLSYLKACAITALLDHNRKERRQLGDVSLSDAIRDEQPDPAREVASSQLWDIVARALPDSPDRDLIELRFRLGLSPGEIAARHERRYRDARGVSIALQRCLRRLGRCYELSELIS